MGMQARIHSITPEAYASVLRGDLDGFNAGWEGIVADLDKSWHAIHFLITGNADSRLLNDGAQVPDVSEQFEVHSPAAVQALHAQFAPTTVQSLMAKFDPKLFNAKEIYPQRWDETWMREYLEENLERFLIAIRDAASAGKAIAVLLI